MRFNTSLMTLLSRARPGNVKQDQSEPGFVELPPTHLISGRYPFPVTLCLQNGENLAVNTEVAGSVIASRQDTLNAAPAIPTWISFPPGVWDIEFYHHVELQGAVNDRTANIEFALNWQDGLNPAKSMSLSRVTGDLNFTQTFSRRFALTVTKDFKISIVIVGSAGLGTCLCVSRGHVLANRIF